MGERITMLVVDDVALNRALLREMFIRDFDILEAADGGEALKMLAAHEVEVILLDIRMPVMDGMETLRRIKADPATAHIPVIMNTACDEQELETQALELGASDFITKPYVPSVVRRRVQNALARTTLDQLTLERELYEVRGQLTSLSDSIPGGIGILRMDGRHVILLYANDTLLRYFGLTQEEFQAARGTIDLVDALAEEDTSTLERVGAEALRHRPIDVSVRARRPEAREFWVRIRASFYKAEPEGAIYHAVFLDITASKRAQSALTDALHDVRHALSHDSLTGIFNFETFSKATAAMLRSDPERPRVMVRWNIERFKMINELYGSEMGDRVLRAMADTLRRQLQGRGTFGRVGSDNFVACFEAEAFDIPHMMDEVEVLLLTESLGNRIVVDTGVYPISNIELPIEVMSDRANMALKTVKGSYLTHCGWYDAHLRESRLQQQAIIDDMEPALEHGEFHVYYQPIVDLETGALAYAEVLARWHHPEQGIISPTTFIPLFEHSGFIIKLDRYIWEHAAQQLRAWIDAGNEPLPLSVNVSRMDFYDSRLVSFFTELVERYQLDPGLLKIEVTESAYVDNPQLLRAALSGLREAGFTVLMDDFGSGYSSFNALKDLQVDTLKIDLGFMGDFERSERAGNIVASIVHMSKWLHMEVVAEGIETASQARFLRSVGCAYGQGFLFSRPIPGSSFWDATVLDGLSRGSGDALSDSDEFDVDALWFSDERTTGVLNRFIGGVAIFRMRDGDPCVVHANATFLEELETDPAQVFIVSLAELISVENTTRLRALLRRARISGALEIDDFPHVGVDGEEHVYNVRTRYLGVGGGDDLFGVVLEDVTRQRLETRRLQEHVKRQNEMYQILVESSTNILLDYSPDRDVLVYSVPDTNGHRREGEQAFLSKLMAPGLWFVHPDDLPRLLDGIRRTTRTRGTLTFEMRVREVGAATGDYYWGEAYLRSVADEEGRIFRVVGSIRNIERIKDLEVKAHTDKLSGLLNRGTLEEKVDEEIRRHPDRDCAFFLYDIDDFKDINDTFGHQAGDQAIRRMAATLREQFRDGDVVGRLGGDELVVFFCGECSGRIIAKKAQDSIAAIGAIVLDGGIELRLSVSLGIAIDSCRRSSFGHLYKAADAALYDVKDMGKNHYAIRIAEAGEEDGPAEPTEAAGKVQAADGGKTDA